MAAIGNWHLFRAQLLETGGEALWRRAYKERFVERLEYRYFGPIKILKAHDKQLGEGFSIMTILCAVIEFLESTRQGKNHRYISRKERKKGIQLRSDEYVDSSEMFRAFLCRREPFAKTFDDTLAVEFYRSIRCALFHEAQTKNGWKIRAKSIDGSLVDRRQKTVFRDDFHRGIVAYVREYEGELIDNIEDCQSGFIRKFDYFASEAAKV